MAGAGHDDRRMSVPPRSPMVTCSGCGAPNPIANVVCGWCGAPLARPAPPAAPPPLKAAPVAPPAPVAAVAELPAEPAASPAPEPPPLPAEPGGAPAGLGRRAAAFTIDVVVLVGGALVLPYTAIDILDATVLSWLVVAWVGVFVPWYFGLYHAFGGPERRYGWTPGQRELHIVVADRTTGSRLPLARCLVRAYVGLIEIVLVVPALIDVLLIAAADDRRGLRDRLTGGQVMQAPVPAWAAPPTSPVTAAAFLPPPAGPGREAVRRGAALARDHRYLIGGSVALVYGGLMALSLIATAIFAGDYAGDDLLGAISLGISYLAMLLGAGVYWTAAVIATAVEGIRTGEAGLTPRVVVRRSMQRLNALSAVFVVLIPIVAAAGYLAVLVAPLLLPARLALVVPAVVLEDRGVGTALSRSWRLTRGRSWRSLGLLALTLAALGGVFLIAFIVITALLQSLTFASLTQLIVFGVVAVLLTAAPVCWLLTVYGTAWTLYYYDLRAAAVGAPGTGVPPIAAPVGGRQIDAAAR